MEQYMFLQKTAVLEQREMLWNDEFVLIYEDYSKQDVEKMAKRLQDKIYSLNIEHRNSRVSDRVTISQGLFHKIPSGGNKTWDFLYGADMALYGVKYRGKNDYFVGTTFDEVRSLDGGKKPPEQNQ